MLKRAIHSHIITSHHVVPLELCDAGLVLLQLVGMPTKLLGTNGVFLLQRLDTLQDTVEFGNDGVEFFIQLLLHKLAKGFQNDICLLGEAFIQPLVKLFFELAEFGP